MKFKVAILGICAALGFAACDSSNQANTTRPTNANSNTAVVVNANSATGETGTMNGNTGSSTATNSNSGTSTGVNWNGTQKEAESQRSSIEKQAKDAGRTIGTGANDWWLWGKTRAALAAVNDLQDSTINVDVENAVVTLSGEVRTQAQVAAADKTAKGIEGVKSVMNKLKVNPNASVMGGNSNAGAANRGAANR